MRCLLFFALFVTQNRNKYKNTIQRNYEANYVNLFPDLPLLVFSLCLVLAVMIAALTLVIPAVSLLTGALLGLLPLMLL